MKCRGERNLCRLLLGSGGGYSIIVILLRDMNRADNLSSNQTLRTHCNAIAERRCQKIAATNYVPIEGAVVCRQLVELSIRAVGLLLAEPFEPDRAEEIGAGLAHIHYLQPEALGGTLQVLAKHLVDGLDPDKGSALQPRLAEILRRLATGFFHQARQTIIQEQEELQAELSAEQERAKRKLRINEIAVASSMNGIAMADREGTVTQVNRSFLDMWGYHALEEVLGRHVLEFWKKGQEAEAALKAVHSGVNWTGALVAKRRDGSLFDVHLSARVVVDDSDGALCMMGSFVDITEQRKMEKALRESQAELEKSKRRLEEVNITLKVLLERRAEDKNTLMERVHLNITELIIPLVRGLRKAALDPQQLVSLDMIESNLNSITSSFSHLLCSRHQELTPMEIRVANLIREGKNTRDIAELMNLSPRTIESHREGLRKKMGIRDRRENLRFHLLSLS
jgi:PAS domain S-box-containing protein